MQLEGSRLRGTGLVIGTRLALGQVTRSDALVSLFEEWTTARVGIA
jgi:hypothetical protein